MMSIKKMIGLKKIMCLIAAVMLTFSIVGCTNQTDNNPTNEQTGQQKEDIPEQQALYPLTITDSYDREVVIEKEPGRIISTGPNVTETIYALGKQDKLVGRTDWCDYPSEVTQIDSIGSLQEPNIEKIAELAPDLVIASTHFKQEVLQKLEELDIKVVVLYGEESFEGVYQTIENIGTVLNAQEKAKEVIKGMQDKVNEVKEKVKGRQKPNVYYVVDLGEYGDFTAGKDTFVGSMIEMAGAKNAADDVEGWEYSLEKLVEKNPDMLICSKYYDAKTRIENTNGYKDLDAVKNGKVYEIDNNLLDRQGARLADGLVELAKIIHPDAFK